MGADVNFDTGTLVVDVEVIKGLPEGTGGVGGGFGGTGGAGGFGGQSEDPEPQSFDAAVACTLPLGLGVAHAGL